MSGYDTPSIGEGSHRRAEEARGVIDREQLEGYGLCLAGFGLACGLVWLVSWLL